MKIKKNKDHSKSSSQSVKKCSTSLGEEYLKKASKKISPGRVKRYGKVAHPSQQKMKEKAILKNIGKN